MSDSFQSLPQDRTLFGRLKACFIDRTLAEMSVWYCILAAGSLVAIVLVLGGLGGPAAILPGLLLWLIFLIWLWISLIRIAWRSAPERMETSTFKYMQVVFIATAFLTLLARNELMKEWKILSLLFLSFDTAVAGMAIVFLALAWCSRSKVPHRTYREILSMGAILTLQVYLTEPWAM
jgi:hypothetical protein